MPIELLRSSRCRGTRFWGPPGMLLDSNLMVDGQESVCISECQSLIDQFEANGRIIFPDYKKMWVIIEWCESKGIPYEVDVDRRLTDVKSGKSFGALISIERKKK